MEAHTALGKQEIRSVKRGYLSHCLNFVKICFPMQNFIEIGQSAAELWPEVIFNRPMAAVSNLDFLEFLHLVT